MPELKPDKKRRPLKNLPQEGWQPKIWLVWLGIVGALVALYVFSPSHTATPAELTIHELVDYARKGEIATATMSPDIASGSRVNYVQVNGELKNPILDSKVKTFHAEGTLSESGLEAMQAAGAKEVPANTFLENLAVALIEMVVFALLVYFLFIRQLRSAGRGALNFGKSRAKMLTRDREKITFGDVAGCDEAKEEISEVVEFLKDPKKFTKMGGRIPKGMLLVGPPGTGKTLLAKAVAGEAEVPFFSVSGSDFVEMFVGVGASRVRDMFDQGRKNAPCIIFIDEIDAVGRHRGAGMGGGHDEREQTLNSLLVEMDGFDTSEGVIIMAATNRAEVLDHALLRPGRFDRQVTVDLPDILGREQILRVHAKKISLADNVDLQVIARGTPGLSGADLANLLNEAALLAARRNKKKVEMIDVEDAREKVQFGREHRRVMDDSEKKLTAYHEAGHALVTAILDDGHLPVHKVTIIPRGGSLGSTMFIPRKDILTEEKKRIETRIAVGCGGRVAEELVLDDISNGATGDIKMVTKLARHMVCDWGMTPLGMVSYSESPEAMYFGREIARNAPYSEETARKIDAEVSRIVDEQYKRATAIITAHRSSLDKIAAALIEFETIEGKHVLEIVQHGELRSPIVRELPTPPAAPTGKDSRRAAPQPAPGAIGGAPAPPPV